jgi:hypothetical protein
MTPSSRQDQAYTVLSRNHRGIAAAFRPQLHLGTQECGISKFPDISRFGRNFPDFGRESSRFAAPLELRRPLIRKILSAIIATEFDFLREFSRGSGNFAGPFALEGAPR